MYNGSDSNTSAHQRCSSAGCLKLQAHLHTQARTPAYILGMVYIIASIYAGVRAFVYHRKLVLLRLKRPLWTSPGLARCRVAHPLL